MTAKIASLSGIVAVALFVGAVILGGLQMEGYSHLSQFISESYAVGTPWGVQLRYGAFLPCGILLMLFCLLAARALPKSALSTLGFLGLALSYGLGTVVVSFFPCDAGCGRSGLEPSLSQLIHNLSGFLTYLGAPISVLLLGVAARHWPGGKLVSVWGMAAGALAMVLNGIFMVSIDSPWTGLCQRLLEGSILSWVVVCAVHLGRRVGTST